MTERAAGFVLIVAMLCVIAWYLTSYRKAFVEECVKSNNTRGYCVMQFWRGI